MAVNLNFDLGSLAGPAPVDPSAVMQRYMTLKDMQDKAEDRRYGRELQAANLATLQSEREANAAYKHAQEADLETKALERETSNIAKQRWADHVQSGGAMTLADAYRVAGPTHGPSLLAEATKANVELIKAKDADYARRVAIGDRAAGTLSRLVDAQASDDDINAEMGKLTAGLLNEYADDPETQKVIAELANDPDLKTPQGRANFIAMSGAATGEHAARVKEQREAASKALADKKTQAEIDHALAQAAAEAQKTKQAVAIGTPQKIQTEHGESFGQLMQFPGEIKPRMVDLEQTPYEQPAKPENLTLDEKTADAWLKANPGKTLVDYQRYQSSLRKEENATRANVGRPLPAGDAGKIADYDNSLNDLATLRGEIGGPGLTGIGAKAGTMVPDFITDWTGIGADAKSKQAVIDRVKQVIGKALEGGVLRKEDEIKYEKILPKIGDTFAVVKAKLDGLEKAIHDARVTKLDAYEDAGYNVSKYRQRAPNAPPPAAAPAPTGASQWQSDGTNYRYSNDGGKTWHDYKGGK